MIKQSLNLHTYPNCNEWASFPSMVQILTFLSKDPVNILRERERGGGERGGEGKVNTMGILHKGSQTHTHTHTHTHTDAHTHTHMHAHMYVHKHSLIQWPTKQRAQAMSLAL